MRREKGNSLFETKRINRALIKNLIFRNETITRTDIAKELSLTLPTITTSINEMLAEGILEEISLKQPSSGSGRPPHAIAFNPDMAYSVGVELGPYFCSLVLLNMRKTVLKRNIVKSPNENYDLMLSEICTHITDLISGYPKHKILGIAIGLPGFVNYSSGIIKANPRKNWNQKPLAMDVEQRIGIKTTIDNNVRIRAIGFELAKIQIGNKPLSYFYISKGVACPIIVRYGIISGHSSGAGELGETILQVGENPEYKTVDDLAGERAIYEECQAYMLAGKLKSLKKILEKKSHFTMEDILELQRNGDPEIIEIINRSIRYLGIALSNVVNLINPKYVVVDSYIMQLEENRETLKQMARPFFFGLNGDDVLFIFQPYDEVWGATAAAIFAISKLYLES